MFLIREYKEKKGLSYRAFFEHKDLYYLVESCTSEKVFNKRVDKLKKDYTKNEFTNIIKNLPSEVVRMTSLKSI